MDLPSSSGEKEEVPLVLDPVDRAIPDGTDPQIGNSSAYRILVSHPFSPEKRSIP
jgi:hypothetical protein